MNRLQMRIKKEREPAVRLYALYCCAVTAMLQVKAHRDCPEYLCILNTLQVFHFMNCLHRGRLYKCDCHIFFMGKPKLDINHEINGILRKSPCHSDSECKGNPN